MGCVRVCVQNHQIDQLKEEISGKDLALVKEHFDHMKVRSTTALQIVFQAISMCPQLVKVSCHYQAVMTDRPASTEHVMSAYLDVEGSIRHGHSSAVCGAEQLGITVTM